MGKYEYEVEQIIRKGETIKIHVYSNNNTDSHFIKFSYKGEEIEKKLVNGYNEWHFIANREMILIDNKNK